MYEDWQQLFGFQMPEEQIGFQAQESPQLTQGLLGDTGNQQPMFTTGSETAAQMAQLAQANNPSANDNLAQRQASAMQIAQQDAARQQQQNQQSMQMIMQLVKMFL